MFIVPAATGRRGIRTPAKIRVTTDLCQEALSPEESDIRPFSDDQNIVIGYACGDERTNYLPAAHWVSCELGGCLFAWLRGDADLSATFGPDFKVLASLEVKPGKNWVEWRRLILSVQHIPKLSYERQHGILLPLLEQILEGPGGERGGGNSFDLRFRQLILNGAGEFAIGGPEGDNGLSGKKLVIDHYGPGVLIGGGARFLARIPTSWTSAARCDPARWPRNSFAEESMRHAWS
jgi:S-adenosylmethionine synthetase